MSGLPPTLLILVPGVLWLLPVALLPLLRRSPPERRVASTAPWRTLTGAGSRSRALTEVVFITLLLLLGSRPILIPGPGSEPRAAAVHLLDGERVLDLDRAALGSAQDPSLPLEDLRVRRGGREWRIAPTESESGILLPPGVVSGEAALHLRCGGEQLRVPLWIPPLPAPTAVLDRSGSEGVARALAALATAGRIVLLTEETPPGSAGHGSPVVVTTVDDAAAPGEGPRLLIPSSGMARTRLLPEIDARSTAGLLDGLQPRRWTILEAVDLQPLGQPVLRDAQGRALISREPGRIRISFRPEWSDLPARDDWPVLLGRCVEALRPTPIPTPPRSRLPSLALLGAALLLLPALQRGSGPALILAGLISLGALLPSSLLLPLPEVELPAGRSAPPWSRLRQGIDALPGGGRLLLPPDLPVPAELSALAARLRARGVQLVPSPRPSAAWQVGAELAFVGEPIRLTGPAGLPLTVQAPPDPTGSAAGEEPDRRTLDERGEGLWVPHRPGVWLVEDDAGNAVAIEVRAPLPVLSIGAETTAVRALFGDPRTWSLLPARSSAEALRRELPPAPGGLILWDGATSAEAEPPLVARLEEWVRRGGVIFTVVAPPFRGSEESQLLDRLLPHPLPPPPRPPRRDHGVLLLDLSGSIRGEALETLWSGVQSLIEETPPEDRWAVAGFREETRWILPPGAPLGPAATARIRAATRTGGGTRLDRALRFAASAIEENEGVRPGILVISDGRTSGAEWGRISETLVAAGIEVSALLVGPQADATVLRPIVTRTGGRWAEAADGASALRVLASMQEEEGDGWRSVVAPLRPVDPVDARWPLDLPLLPRRWSTEAALAPDTRLTWVDGEGAPLLVERRIARGRSLLLLAGLDRTSLPPGPAAEELREILARGLARTIVERPPDLRLSFATVDRWGSPATWVSRDPGEPIPVEAWIVSPSGERTPAPVSLGAAGGTSIPGPVPRGGRAEVAGARSGPRLGTRSEAVDAWWTILPQLPEGTDRGRVSFGSLILIGVALQRALRRLERAPIPTEGGGRPPPWPTIASSVKSERTSLTGAIPPPRP